jgi:hypothetical protein
VINHARFKEYPENMEFPNNGSLLAGGTSLSRTGIPETTKKNV